MSENKSDPQKRLNTPDSPASPAVGPDQQALAVIEQAAREMATRRPRRFAPPQDEAPAAYIPVEPATPSEQFTSPAAAAPMEDFKPIIAMDPFDEPAPVQVAAATARTAIQQPPEIAAEIESVNVRELAKESEDAIEDAKVFELSEPVAEAAAKMRTEFESLTAPIETFAATTSDTSPKVLPPTAPSARPKAAPAKTPPAARPMYDDHFHLTLTGAQSIAVAIAIFAFVIAAFGMAARGWVVAHDWSCRVGMATNSCPPARPPKSLGLAEIPS